LPTTRFGVPVLELTFAWGEGVDDKTGDDGRRIGKREKKSRTTTYRLEKRSSYEEKNRTVSASVKGQPTVCGAKGAGEMDGRNACPQ